jgi:hypothetical protein
VKHCVMCVCWGLSGKCNEISMGKEFVFVVVVLF